MKRFFALLSFILFVAIQLSAQADADWFVTLWRSDNPSSRTDNTDTTIAFPGNGTNYTLYWEKEDNPSVKGSVTVNSSSSISPYILSVPEVGKYLIKVVPGSGVFNGISHSFSWPSKKDSEKLLEVKQWGSIVWETLTDAFRSCSNMQITATDAPNLSQCESLLQMFYQASGFNSDINFWDVSNIKDMTYMFGHATSFNQPLDNWDVSNVTNMENMFRGALSFNQSLNNWDVSNVTNMAYMFAYTNDFNKPLNNWNLSSLVHIHHMFHCTKSFNQSLNDWDVGSLNSMYAVFERAEAFNQPLDKWDVSNVTDMRLMFHKSKSFNQDINSWDVSNVQNMYSMFREASSFNKPLNDWDMSSVKNIDYMFYRAISFNQPLNNWDVSNITSMFAVFEFAEVFNQPLNQWDVGNVETMTNLFHHASSFNQNINNWDVSKVKAMHSVFAEAIAFNQPLNDWDVSSVEDMTHILSATDAFNQPLDNWDVSNVKKLRNAFRGARAFNQNLGSWNLKSITSIDRMLLASGLDCNNYSATLNGWADNPESPDFLSFGNTTPLVYNSTALDAHNKLTVEKSWNITNDAYDEDCGTLPIELYSFTAKEENNKVLLEWVSLSETNNDVYTVYKSHDGTNWEFVSEVSGAGNSSDKQLYSLEDNQPYDGISYYRLTQTDFDGTTEELGIRSVKIEDLLSSSGTLNVYPSPAEHFLTVELHGGKLNYFKLINALGVDVSSSASVIKKSESKCLMDISGLPSGVYFIVNKENSIKVIKR